jgi:hypothetical protein
LPSPYGASGKRVLSGPYKDLYLAEMRWRIENGGACSLGEHFRTLDDGEHEFLLGARDVGDHFEVVAVVTHCTDEADARKVLACLKDDLIYRLTAIEGEPFDHESFMDAGFKLSADSGWTVTCAIGKYETPAECIATLPAMQAYAYTLAGLMTPSTRPQYDA